ncbi:hypothetical protein P879_03265 [Paragonimus westermani]|uniref:Uncharacterized protein n=1 Tax=Paragonimus westermani TaxID=34504 RepID=A0A8T0DAG6_9TREM|nr:hypothetical protein P879_03265 [Paragonimus westermani]
MLPRIILHSICCLCTVLTSVLASQFSTHNLCNCTLSNEKPVNSTQDLHILRCQRGAPSVDSTQQIPCQRVNNLIRIGPIGSDMQVPWENGSMSIVTPDTIKIAPWGFVDLFADGSVQRLQLDLRLGEHKIDALSMAGLHNLQMLLTRTSLVTWDSCSLSNLPKMEQLLLSCKSNFEEFLTLGSAIRIVRFVDCEEAPLQFYCINCLQDPSVNVIRVRPGPPLKQYMVKFSQFQLADRLEEPPTVEDLDQISIGQCMPNICSDSMLCRDNVPLQMALLNEGRPTAKSTETESPNVVWYVEEDEPRTHSVSTHSWIPTDRRSASPHTSQKPKSVLTQHLLYLPRNKRIWIAGTIISVIVAFLVTLCVIIGLTRRRDRKLQGKFSRSRTRSRMVPNGICREPAIILIGETKLEPPPEPV